jgi:DNA mismatch repair protein MutS2
MIGLPGRSNALAIAERLGLPESIIQAARAEIDPTDLRAEDLLDEIHRQRELEQQARIATQAAQLEAETLRDELAQRLDQIEDERYALLEQSRQVAESSLTVLQDEIESLRNKLAKARQPLDIVDEVKEIASVLVEEVTEPILRKAPARQVRSPKGPLRLGEKVHLRSIDQDGILTGIGEDELEVQVGMLRVRARRLDVVRKAEFVEETQEKKTSAPKSGITLPVIQNSPGVELDIRGQRVDEGLDALERYIERAYLVGLPFVRIIHGKGTGRLRDSVRTALTGNPHIRSFESGGQSEGGEGVTVVHLKTG